MLFKPLRFNGREEYGKETNQNPKNLLHFSSIRGSMLPAKHLMRFLFRFLSLCFSTCGYKALCLEIILLRRLFV